MSDEMNSEPTPETIKLDPASNDDALRLAAAIRSVCDIDGRWDAAEILHALATPPLPEEPPAWTLVATNHGNPVRVFYRVEDREGMRRPWHAVSGGWHTWAEVCAAAQEDSGGTPEVLEPESVKDLRKTLADVETRAKEWAEKDDEVTAMHSLTILNTTNRHGRELLHLLGANGDDEPPALEAS